MRAALVGLVALGAIAGCATLDTSKMSDRCRGLYNACLDGCPKPTRTVNDPIAPDFVTPDCVNRCNAEVKDCK